MSSFGEQLKREREKKKISLDQVAVSTKIGVRMLRALEEDKFEQLPGGIFNKGFVRAYARYLGMDEERAVSDYLAASQPTQSPAPEDLELRAMAEQKDKERQRQARLAKDSPWGWVAMGLLLIALGFALWGGRSGHGENGTTVLQRESHIESRPAAQPQVKADSSRANQIVLKESTASPSAAIPASAVENSATSSRSVTAEAKKTSDANSSDEPEVIVRKTAPMTSAAPRTSPAGPMFAVLVTARENSWLSITTDGKEVFAGTLIAPGVQLLHARNAIVIRAGNIGGLDIDFNGNRIPSQGNEGEAKTLTFHSDGLGAAPATLPSQ